MERRLVKIGQAASMIGSTPATLRRWEKTGDLVPAWKTKGGTRYYDIEDLKKLLSKCTVETS
jgi:DNA-binding transcriptional MerR regulator